jgi:hypothetical protein
LLGASRLLLGHGFLKDGVHIAAGSQLVKPVNRQHCPLPAALPRLNHLNGHVLLALGQLPDLLRQDIKGDRSLVLGVLVHNELGELVFTCLATR